MKKTILQVPLIIALLLGTTLYAQFNVNKLKDKAKSISTKEKKQETTTPSSSTTNSSTSTTNTQEPVSSTTNTTINIAQLSTKDLSDGTFYFSGKKLYGSMAGETIELTNISAEGPITSNSKYNGRKIYKKSAYVENLFYENKYLLFDKEKGVIIYFKGDPGYGTVDKNEFFVVSKDPNVKNVDAEEERPLAEKAMQIVKSKLDEKYAEEKKVKIEARKIPVENMKNPTLAKDALACLNEHATKEKYGYSFSKAYLCSKDWEIVKHKYSGAILYRTIEVGVTYSKDGKCHVLYYSVKQDYAGASFQKTLQYNGVMMERDAGEINCNKIK